MEVQGILKTTIDVNPVDVVDGLITKFLHGDNYDTFIASKNGEYLLMKSRSEYHNRIEYDVICVLTQEDVDYFNALKQIQEYLKKL